MKVVELASVQLQGPVVFAEGLEKLYLTKVDSEYSLLTWVFPASLRKLFYKGVKDKDADLRAVTAPYISMDGLGDVLFQALFPEALDELKLDGGMGMTAIRVTFPELIEGVTDNEAYLTRAIIDYDNSRGAEYDPENPTRIILLPPYLRRLTLESIDEISIHGPSQTEQIRDLAISFPEGQYDLEGLFPELETLVFGPTKTSRSRPLKFKVIRHAALKSLTLTEVYTHRRVTIDCPELESLTINNPDGNIGKYVFKNINDSLVSLTLNGVSEFPKVVAEKEGSSSDDEASEGVTDWNRLESVTITDSDIELPYIPWLNELNMDRPLMSKGQEIRDISEYRMVWGRAAAKR